MSNFIVPNRPQGSDPRHIADIIADFDYVTGLLDKSVSGRELIWRAKASVMGNVTMSGSGTAYFTDGPGGYAVSGYYTSDPVHVLYWDPSDYAALAGKTGQLLLHLQAACGGSPGTNFVIELYAASLANDGTSDITVNFGAQVGYPVSVSMFSPNSCNKADSQPFAFPSIGTYAVGLTPGGPTTLNSFTSIDASLWLQYT